MSDLRHVVAGGCLLLVVIAAAATGGAVAVRAGTDVQATVAPRDPVADARAGKWPLAELTSGRLTQQTAAMSLMVPDEPVLAEVRAIIDQATTDYGFAAGAAATAPDGAIVAEVTFGPSVGEDLAASVAASISTQPGVAVTTSSTQGMAFEFQAQFVAGSPASLAPGGFSAPTSERIGALIPDGATWAAQVGEDLVGLVYRGPVLSTQTLRTLREAVATEAAVEVVDVSVLPTA